MTSVKQKLGNIFKDKDTSHLQEQISILNTLLISKEEDRKRTERLHKDIINLAKEKERKSQTILEEKNLRIRQLERDVLQCDEEFFQKDKRIALLEKHVEEGRRKVEQLESQLESARKEANDNLRFQTETIRLRQNLRALENENDKLRHNLEDMVQGKSNLFSSQCEQTRALELTNAFLETSSLVHSFDKEDLFPDSTSSTTNRFNSELSQLLLQMSFLLGQNIEEIFDKSLLTPEMFMHLRSLENKMKLRDKELNDNVEKIRILEEILQLKDSVIQQCQEKTEAIQRQLSFRESEESNAVRRLTTLEDELVSHEESTANKLSQDLRVKELQIQTVQSEIERLSEEMRQKEKDLSELFDLLHKAELEVEEKDNEFSILSEKLRQYNWKLRERENELRALQEKTSLLEDDIFENDSLMMTYSSIHQAKLNSLQEKEDLIVQFEDLFHPKDEEIHFEDEEGKSLFQNVKIIDNYATQPSVATNTSN